MVGLGKLPLAWYHSHGRLPCGWLLSLQKVVVKNANEDVNIKQRERFKALPLLRLQAFNAGGHRFDPRLEK